MEGCSSQYCKISNIKIVHGNHRLCEECLGENFEKYNTIECSECKNSAWALMQNYYLCECEFSFENYYLKTCKNHVYCGYCIKYTNIKDKCEFCEDTFCKKEICMYHFDIIEKNLSIINPSCSNYFSHTYCEDAFAQFNEEFNSLLNQCHWCKLLYSEVEVPAQMCSLCKSNHIDGTQIPFCDNHKYCNKCIKYFTLKAFKFLFNNQDCKSCGDHFKILLRTQKNEEYICIEKKLENLCNCCNKRSGMLILNPSCIKNHFYCSGCFNSNIDRIKKKCEKCTVYYGEYKVYACFLCKKENFNLINFQTCRDHTFCLRCIKILLNSNQEYKIKCKKCLSYFKSKVDTCKHQSNPKYTVDYTHENNSRKCFGCRSNLPDNLAYTNPSCNSTHIYCEGCFRERLYSKFECESCENFNSVGLLKFCDMCKSTTLDGSRVTHCNFHSYCIYCIDILNKDNYNLYSLKDYCEKCENYFRKSNLITEENINSCIFTDLFCFSCATKLTEKISVLNLACAYNHIFCLNCYEALETSGFKCESCQKTTEVNSRYYCSLCKIKLNTDKGTICENHNYCDICKKTVNLKPFPVYKQIKNCQNCNSYFFGKLNTNNILKDSKGNLKAPKGNNKNQQINKNTMKIESNKKSIAYENKAQESIEERKVCYENPPPQIDITNYPENNQSILSLTSNLNYKIFQDSFGVCKFCSSLGKLMECQHPFCYACFLQSFRIKFNNFLNTLRQGINPANYENQVIKCIYENCNNRFCVPFNLFKETAIEDMKLHGLYVEGIIDYYSLHFQGFPLSFYYCYCCNGGVYIGIYQGDPVVCHYCKSNLTCNFNAGSYY